MRVSLVIPSSLLLIQVNRGSHHLSLEDALNNKTVFSLLLFCLSLSPLNLFVFAADKIETPSEALELMV